MALLDREKSLFLAPNYKNRFLAFEVFDSKYNREFYKRSLLLRILMDVGDKSTSLFWQYKKNELGKGGFGGTIILKKRGLELMLSFDTVTGAAKKIQSENFMKEGQVFETDVPNSSFLIPTPIGTQEVIDFSFGLTIQRN